MVDLELNSYSESSKFLEDVEDTFRTFARDKGMFDFEYDIKYDLENDLISFMYKDGSDKVIGVSGPYGDDSIVDGCAYRRTPSGLERAEMPLGQVRTENLMAHLDSVYGALEEPDNWNSV